jgi:hypothetical protein
MVDYIARVVFLIDSLNIIGVSLSEEEISLYLLGGLGFKYEAIVTSITTQPSLSLEDIQGMHLNYEL